MKRTFAIVLVAAVLAGCRQSVDLSAVRAMAKTAADAKGSYDALATDYYDSCMRRMQLDSIGDGLRSAIENVGSGFATPAPKLPPRPTAKPALRPRPTATPAPIARATPYPAGLSPSDLAAAAPDEVVRLATASAIASFDSKQFIKLVDRDDFVDVEARFSGDQRAALERRAATIEHGRVYGCREAAVSADQWRKTNDILIGYFLALGDLAGSASGDDRYGIGALAGQLHTSKVIPNDPAPFAAAVTGLVRAGFDAKRRDAIANFLKAGSPLVDDAIVRLGAAARKHYVANQLRQERDSLETFLLLNRKYAKPGADAFAVYGYAKAWKEERKAIDDREVAANAYVASLGKLGAAHKEILKAANANDLRSAVAVAVAASNEVRSDLDTIDKAFVKKK